MQDHLQTWYKLSSDDVRKQLDSLSDGGLTEEDALGRLEKYGHNRLPEAKTPSVWLICLSQFLSPLIYILLFAGIVTVFMQEYPGAIFIFIVLLVNAIVGTMQEYSANNAAMALRKMITYLASVKRDDKVQEINTTQLVPVHWLLRTKLGH